MSEHNLAAGFFLYFFNYLKEQNISVKILPYEAFDVVNEVMPLNRGISFTVRKWFFA